MRQWHVDPRLLCRKHLLGEHVEHHMFAASVGKRNLSGYIDGGLLAPKTLEKRHDELAQEMVRRGYRHVSPLGRVSLPADLADENGSVDPMENVRELVRRCEECRQLVEIEGWLPARQESGDGWLLPDGHRAGHG